MPARSPDTYLFIDGEYLRRIFKGAVQNILMSSVTDEDIDYVELKRQADAKRASSTIVSTTKNSMVKAMPIFRSGFVLKRLSSTNSAG
jgi:hypothetical protein